MISSTRKGRDRTCSTHGSDKEHILNFVTDYLQRSHFHEGLVCSLRKFWKSMCSRRVWLSTCTGDVLLEHGKCFIKGKEFLQHARDYWLLRSESFKHKVTKFDLVENCVFTCFKQTQSAQMCSHATSVFLIFLHQRL